MAESKAHSATQSYFVLQMPSGEYLREVFESYEDDEGNYTTTPTVLSAFKMHLNAKYTSELFYHYSALSAPKYFIYYVPPGRKRGRYYQTIEDFCKATGASVKYVSVKTTVTEDVSDVYCRYLSDTEVHIKHLPLSVLDQMKQDYWEAEKRASSKN